MRATGFNRAHRCAMRGTTGTALRATAFIVSLIGLALPAAVCTGFGTTVSTSGLEIAPWAILAPLLIFVTLFMEHLAPHRARLADIGAAILLETVLLTLSYAVFDAAQTVPGPMSDASDLIRGMAGSAAALNYYADSYGQSPGVSVMPGTGLLALIFAASLMIVLTLRPSR